LAGFEVSTYGRFSGVHRGPLVYVEQLPSKTNDKGVSNAYRIVGIEPRFNMATRGRGLTEGDLVPVDYA
jgi:hypothetical protein